MPAVEPAELLSEEKEYDVVVPHQPRDHRKDQP